MRGEGERQRADDLDAEMIKMVFEELHKCAETIYGKWPLYPGFAPIDKTTTSNLPGYKVFADLSNRDKYYLFLCALGASARARRIEKNIIAAAEKVSAVAPAGG